MNHSDDARLPDDFAELIVKASFQVLGMIVYEIVVLVVVAVYVIVVEEQDFEHVGRFAEGTDDFSPTFLRLEQLPISLTERCSIGEIAIRHRITGPNLCFVGDSQNVLSEAADFIRRGEADGCICVYVNVVSPSLAGFISSPVTARACASFMQRGESGLYLWQENDRDMEALCATLRPKISTK